MTFKKILVALDGSKNSQIAAEYGFWLASGLGAELAGQHVVDPRLVDLFVEPEFAQELGFARSVDTSEKVYTALRRIGNVILELFATEAVSRSLRTTVFLDEGHVVDEILNYAGEFDLLVVGHRGRGQSKLPAHLMLGSVAERVVAGSSVPVLATVQPVEQIEQILVAYDGSELSRSALLMAESFAKDTGRPLKAVTVVKSASHSKEQTKLLIEQGQAYLREKHAEEVFIVKEADRAIASTIIDFAASSNSLLIVGSYGFSDPEKNVLGTTTTNIIRGLKTSVLVYKPLAPAKTKNQHEKDLIKRIYA